MKFFIVAGETSGDVHGSNLAAELLKIYPDAKFAGTGGSRLKALGQQQYCTEREMAIIGFVEVIKKLPFIFGLFKKLERAVVEEKPDCIILVDYPGFNLRFAKRIKKYGIPIVYFVAPQFWVWDYKRIYTLRDYCDLTLSIYPFETEALQKAGVESKYVGNPIIDNFKYKFDSKAEFLSAANLNGSKPLIGLLPGSRMKELEGLLKLFLDTSRRYRDEFDFVVSAAESLPEGSVEKICATYGVPVLRGAQYDIMKYSDYIWACSGTVTLECTLHKKPTLIAYRASGINLWLAMTISKLRVIGLPNIMAGKKFLPEPAGPDIDSDDIAKAHEQLVEDRENIVSRLEGMAIMFEGCTPSVTAAAEISSLLEKVKSKKS